MARSGSSEVRTPIFSCENYEFWKIMTMTIFKSYGLWNLVEKGILVSESKKKKKATEETSEEEDDEKAAAILIKDAKALGIIQNAVSDQIFPRIANADSTKAAWELLYGEFHGGDHVRSEVKSLVVLPSGVGAFNKQGMRPHEVFTQNHNKLKEEGEKWMKDTATSCTVVGALTITIMFAAAFTVPGGNNGGTGFPLFLDEKMFMVFIVSDAISLFSSTTSVLMFLGILTSRYAEDDFLKSLPTKMIIGLSTLLISIASMMVAFCSALFLMLHERLWIVIPIIFLASVPVTLFIWMQFPLLVEIFISTHGGGIFDKKVRRWI